MHYESGSIAKANDFYHEAQHPALTNTPSFMVLSGSASGSREPRASEEAAHDLPSSKVPPPHEAFILGFFFFLCARHTKRYKTDTILFQRKGWVVIITSSKRSECAHHSLIILGDRGTKWKKDKRWNRFWKRMWFFVWEWNETHSSSSLVV